ncbi:MAG: tetratricopeptide repeat protein [Opitutales bacterium]
MARHTKRIGLILTFGVLLLAFGPSSVMAERRGHLLDEEQIELETHAKMREIERYQMQIAQKFYMAGLDKESKNDFKAAASEYEKFLTLYERSPGGPHALLMWSHCQVQLRLVNTAIREGFQSVIDYWPESHEAIVAHFMIGKCHALNGESQKADKAFKQVLADYPKDVFATRACEEMLPIAYKRKDVERQVELWTALVFQTPKNKQVHLHAGNLAKHHFRQSEFVKGMEAIKNCPQKEIEFITRVYQNGAAVTSELWVSDKTKTQAEKLGAEVISFLEKQIPSNLADAKAKATAENLFLWTADVRKRLDQDKQVIATYERVGKTLGMEDRILAGLADWHKKKDRRDQARSTYGRYKDKEASLRAIATSFMEEKKYDQARSIYGRYADKVEGRLAIADSFKAEQKWAEAVKHYLALIGLDKEREAQWQHKVVATWEDAHQWDKAIATYRILLKVDPDRYSSWYWQIAKCHEHKKQWSQAIQAYRQSDNYPAGYYAMAHCHRQLKKWKEAILLLRQAKSHDNEGPKAQLLIAKYYEHAGQKENAIKSFQITCKSFPRSTQASEAHRLLQDNYGISVTLGGAIDE